MVSDAQLKAQYRYDKANTQQIVLKLNVKSDADILALLENENNKQGYIKALLRSDMRNEGGVLALDSIKYLLMPIVKKYEISSLSIFGSYARNEARPDSDVDILIDGGNFQGLIEYSDMVCAMKTALGRDVDVITKSSLDAAKTKSDFRFKTNVEREKVVLFEN